MSNLDNVYRNCPALMSDGRTSVITDYKSKNTTFKEMIGTSANSFEYRNKLQSSGLTNLQNDVKFNMCSTVPLGDIKFNKNINIEYNTTGSFRDAFTLLTSAKTN